MSNWRLLITPPASASSNMAIDEALLNVSQQPTLRFYSWESPSISIGHFQDVGEDFLQTCNDLAIPLVRRPTGGRAILHHMEITYSLTASYDLFPGASTLTEIYKLLAFWQIESFKALGLNADMRGRRGQERRYEKSAACFMTATPYEVHLGGKKICGSAQKRGKTSFLQHGSILVDVDLDLMQKVLGIENSDPRTFTTLKREGYKGSVSRVIDVMAQMLTSVAGCDLASGTLSAEEISEKDRLLKENYLTPVNP